MIEISQSTPMAVIEMVVKGVKQSTSQSTVCESPTSTLVKYLDAGAKHQAEARSGKYYSRWGQNPQAPGCSSVSLDQYKDKILQEWASRAQRVKEVREGGCLTRLC